MKRIALFCLLLISNILVAKSESKGATIRVALSESISGALVEVKGPYYVMDLTQNEKLSSGGAGKRFPLFMIEEGLRWGEEYPGTFSIGIVPESDKASLFVEGIQYKGSLIVYGREDGTILLINELPIEDYIDSTLSAELNHSLSSEALSALAIQARTIAYKAAVDGKNNKRFWDVIKSDTQYYGYGVTRKNAIQEAIRDTSHIVILDGNTPKNILTGEKAEELAQKGLDARSILKKGSGITQFGTTSSLR